MMSYEFDDLLECYPDELVESLQRRDQWREQMSQQSDDLEFLVSDVDGWRPGSTVTVAFLGGDAELHRRIATTVHEIELVCNLSFDFGAQGSGPLRQWSLNDETASADIRVSFDMKGYWSLVGTASVDPTVGTAGGGVGGRPYQRSLNLSGFDRKLPKTWRRTVIHEFLHAIAFKHEHQLLEGPCRTEFRWEDDSGYVPTRDSDERYITDDRGRRPGIYTYLSGHPNKWSKAKVDHNLRAVSGKGMTGGEFDRASVMLYRFPGLFYQSSPSPCAPKDQGEMLSDGDCQGLQHLYPRDNGLTYRRSRRCLDALDDGGSQEGLETVSSADDMYLEASRGLLERLGASE